MKRKDEYIKIGDKNYPSNLAMLIKVGGLVDYSLEYVYFLQKKCTIGGHYEGDLLPALINSTKRIVITPNEKVIKKIFELLPATGTQEIRKSFFYVHKGKKTVCYPAEHCTHANSFPCQMITEAEFETLIKEKKKPFKWASSREKTIDIMYF